MSLLAGLSKPVNDEVRLGRLILSMNIEIVGGTARRAMAMHPRARCGGSRVTCVVTWATDLAAFSLDTRFTTGCIDRVHDRNPSEALIVLRRWTARSARPMASRRAPRMGAPFGCTCYRGVISGCNHDRLFRGLHPSSRQRAQRPSLGATCSDSLVARYRDRLLRLATSGTSVAAFALPGMYEVRAKPRAASMRSGCRRTRFSRTGFCASASSARVGLATERRASGITQTSAT